MNESASGAPPPDDPGDPPAPGDGAPAAKYHVEVSRSEHIRIGDTYNTHGGNVTFAMSARQPGGSLGIAQRWMLALAALTLAGVLVLTLSEANSARGQGLAVWIVVTFLVTATLVVAPWKASLRRGGSSVSTVTPTTARQFLIERVRLLWIDQALHRSLKQVVRLEVGLDKHPELVRDPWGSDRLEVLETPEPEHADVKLETLSPGGRTRLILIGSPGAGKTTQLLEFGEYLLSKADDDDSRPVPIVLRLSDWTGRQSSLDEWVVLELGLRYLVARNQARLLLEGGALTLLLDGIDEVPEGRRAACLSAIEDFCRDNRFLSVGLLVTCRRAEYEALGRRLPFDHGVAVRPLGAAQVTHYLDRLGHRFEALRQSFDQASDLRALLATPLMLSIAILATADLAPEARVQGERLYPMYVARMLQRVRSLRASQPLGQDFPFTSIETVRHLIWLARLMEDQGQTVFYPDWITPAWVPGRATPWQLPHRGGPLGVMARRVGWDHTSTALIGAGYAGLITALVGAPLGAQIGGWKAAVIVAAVSALFTATCVGVVFGLILTTSAGGRLGLLIGQASTTPHSAARWRWSWRAAARGIRSASLAAAIVVAIGIPLASIPEGITVFSVMMLGGFLGSGSVPDHDEPVTSPGLALSSSIRRLALLMGLLAAIVTISASGIALLGGPWTAMVAALPLAGAIMLVSGPGRAWLRSRAARFGLSSAGLLPHDLVGFLLHADERILLRRGGGGFQFVHRTMQEHLARQDPDSYLQQEL